MESIKILNLYSGIGGNRKLWKDVDVTAVEYNAEIASIYIKNFPEDTVVIADAHQYLIENYMNFDFIWSSPPCPSHSRINTDGNHVARYPDMVLYQEIIMLGNNWFKGYWIIENVIPYYKPLIEPSIEIDRHLFWCNFPIEHIMVDPEKPIAYQTGTNGRYGFNLKGVSVKHDKRQILRNLVNPEIGNRILNEAKREMGMSIKEEQAQGRLF